MTEQVPPAWFICDPLYEAIRLAAAAHQGQLDKGGDPYLWHVLRVGISLLPDLDAAIVGVLHDMLEDCQAFEGAVIDMVTPRQYLSIRALTRHSSETYDAYIERVAASTPLVRKVKLADLEDNLRPDRLASAQSSGVDVGRLIDRYIRARDRLGSRPDEPQQT